MTRTKWLRLGVREPGDILRWAGEQDIRRLDEFRHRVIRGREFVSFRMVPRYAIEIGTADIIVVAHVEAGRRQRALAAGRALGRRALRLGAALAATLQRREAAAPPPIAEVYAFTATRVLSRR